MTSNSNFAGLDYIPFDGYRAQLHPPGTVLPGEAFIALRAHFGKPLDTEEIDLIRAYPHCVVVTSGDEWDLDDLCWLSDEA